VTASAPLFGWLTVIVTDTVVELRFGVGAIRKRVRLDEITSIAPVTNAWIHGWGIRLIPAAGSTTCRVRRLWSSS
jgi:hypothetical protein